MTKQEEEYLDVAVRAYTEIIDDRGAHNHEEAPIADMKGSPAKSRLKRDEPRPDYLLVLDTETSTGIPKAMKVGKAILFRKTDHITGITQVKGWQSVIEFLIYDPEALSDEEQQTLRSYYERLPSRSSLHVRSSDEISKRFSARYEDGSYTTKFLANQVKRRMWLGKNPKCSKCGETRRQALSRRRWASAILCFECRTKQKTQIHHVYGKEHDITVEIPANLHQGLSAFEIPQVDAEWADRLSTAVPPRIPDVDLPFFLDSGLSDDALYQPRCGPDSHSPSSPGYSESLAEDVEVPSYRIETHLDKFHADDLRGFRTPRRFEANAETLDKLRQAKPGTSPKKSSLKLLKRMKANQNRYFISDAPVVLTDKAGFLERFYELSFSARVHVIGFNVPFDLSMLAIKSTSGRNSEDFSLQYWKNRRSEKDRSYRPRILITKRGAKGHTFRYTALDRESPAVRGNFTDIQTLLFSLRSQSFSLKSAGDKFNVIHKKLDTSYDTVDSELLKYMREDVLCTFEVAVEAFEEFDKHPVSREFAQGKVKGHKSETSVMSAAGIDKAYFRQMGIVPPLEKSTLSPLQLAQTIQTFNGGRVGTQIRKMPIPGIPVDFLSEYPTGMVLLGISDLLCATEIHSQDVTSEVQSFLNSVTLETCFDPNSLTWSPIFVQIQPEKDILPVRARYDRTTWNIGLNPLTSRYSHWLAFQDVIGSTLLTGNVPRVIQAFQIVPHGRQKLKALPFNDGQIIDPNREDIFKSIIERKASAKDDATKYALKIIANASYGCFAEFNKYHEQSEVEIHGFHGSYKATQKVVEKGGEYCFPPFASSITASGRLFLTMLERAVTDAGGNYVMTDTDAMFIVATRTGKWPEGLKQPEGVRALSWNQVEKIRKRFNSLHPYDRSKVPGDLLELEEENFGLEGIDDNGKPVTSKKQEQLYCYSVSSKRYALFNVRSMDEGLINLRSWSEHGTGHLLNPKAPGAEAIEAQPFEDAGSEESEDPEKKYLRVQPRSPHKAWIKEMWEFIVATDGFGEAADPPSWVDSVAVGRFNISSPEFLKACDHINGRISGTTRHNIELRLEACERRIEKAESQFKGGQLANETRKDRIEQKKLTILLSRSEKPYKEQIKPFDFLITCFPLMVTDTSKKRSRLVAPFDTDSANWTETSWLNLGNDTFVTITPSSQANDEYFFDYNDSIVVKTMGDILKDYAGHIESKYLGPDNKKVDEETKGLLKRRSIVVREVRNIGKVSQSLEELRVNREIPEYKDHSDTTWKEIRKVGRQIGFEETKRRFKREVDRQRRRGMAEQSLVEAVKDFSEKINSRIWYRYFEEGQKPDLGKEIDHVGNTHYSIVLKAIGISCQSLINERSGTKISVETLDPMSAVIEYLKEPVRTVRTCKYRYCNEELVRRQRDWHSSACKMAEVREREIDSGKPMRSDLQALILVPEPAGELT